MDMICLMHEGEPYGHLRTSAGDVTNSFLSRISGLTLKQVSDFLGQLKSFNVYSITESGTIYSRRMVRDESIREARAQGGQKSVLNPNVPRSKKVPEIDGDRMVERISLEASLGGSPSSSSSSSSENLKTICASDDARAFVLEPSKNGTGHGKAKPIREEEPADFAVFWELRWSSKARKAAVKAFRKKATSPGRVQVIMAAVALQKAEMLARPLDKRPYMSTWLNDDRFLDEAEPEQLANPGERTVYKYV